MRIPAARTGLVGPKPGPGLIPFGPNDSRPQASADIWAGQARSAWLGGHLLAFEGGQRQGGITEFTQGVMAAALPVGSRSVLSRRPQRMFAVFRLARHDAVNTRRMGEHAPGVHSLNTSGLRSPE